MANTPEEKISRLPERREDLGRGEPRRHPGDVAIARALGEAELDAERLRLSPEATREDAQGRAMTLAELVHR